MHWLQSLDTALFHFINGTLANPVFDRIMPLLSGYNVPWLPAALIGVVWILLRGPVRLKIFTLLAVLMIAVGDPLIVGTVKHAVSRPRPFVTLPDARLYLPDAHRFEVGRGFVQPMANGELPATANRNSMPSAHAASWFALAMTGLIFYRRSAKYLFPIAAAVAFSRIYNGVHYPTDVTAGAILGAGWAVAFLVLAQSLWNAAGKKLFPAWHAQLPSLLSAECGMRNAECGTRNAELPNSALRTPNSELEWLHLGYLVIVVALIARWVYLAAGPLDLSGDEAYQWTWSKHLALSYYSKPFGIALLHKLGTLIGGDTEFGVRFCSPLISAITGLMVLRFLAREASPRTGFWVLIATLAVPVLCLGSILITVDPPLVLCWLWATLAGWRAAQPDGKTRDWLIVGLAIGLGFLCKYTAALQIVCWVILFALLPAARVHLRRPGPWLGLGVFALCTLPVIIWNAQHDWISATHVAGNAQLDKQWHPTLKYFGEFFAGEAGSLNPIFFAAMLWAVIAFWKRRVEKPLWLFLACMGAPLFFGYWIYSLHSRVQLNWPVAAVPPLFCLTALYWHERPTAAKRLLIAGLIIGLPCAALIHDSDVAKVISAKLPGDVDFAHRFRGWKETAETIEAEREKFDTNAFIIADDYGSTGLYTFYSPKARQAAVSETPLVYSFLKGAPVNQYYLWDSYDYRKHRVGQNALFVDHVEYYKLERGWFWKWLKREPVKYREPAPAYSLPKAYADQFESVTNLGIREVRLKDGRVFHRVQLYGCYHLKPDADENHSAGQ